MPRSLETHRCPAWWALLALLLAAMPLRAQQMDSTPSAAPPETPAWPSLEGGGAYVFFQDHDVTLVNGTAREYARGKALRTGPQEQLFWFQRAGKEYVIRDPATLKQLQAVFEPQMRLGGQQAALGEKQTQLAGEDTDLVAQLDEQGEQQAEIGLRMSQLATEQARLQEQGESTEAIEAEIQGLVEEQGNLEEPQSQLAIQRDGIQQQLETLARQQEDLGRKLEQAAREAQARLNGLVSQALSKGTAKEVKAGKGLSALPTQGVALG